MIFESREDAAAQLAERLSYLKGQRPLVLAIPRGAVPMGRILADRLDGDLDVVLVRKLRSPFNREFAIGAIDEAGAFELSADAAYAGGGRDALEREKAEQLARIRACRSAWSQLSPGVDPEGRVVVVVDDGIATGATMLAALRFVRRREPRLLACAVPVASEVGLHNVKDVADEVVVVDVPNYFGAVSRFYRRFPPIEDEEVGRLLAAWPVRSRPGTPSLRSGT